MVAPVALALPVERRMVAKVDREFGQFNPPPLGSCWHWTGALNSDHYGVLRVAGRLELAHRVALSIALGRPIGAGLWVLHKCDNPTCVRPRHLYEGTPLDNVEDMYRRGRRRFG